MTDSGANSEDNNVPTTPNISDNTDNNSPNFIPEKIQETVASLVAHTRVMPADKLPPKSIEKIVEKGIEVEREKEEHQYEVQKRFLFYVFIGVLTVVILLGVVSIFCLIYGNTEILRLLIVGISCFFGGAYWGKVQS